MPWKRVKFDEMRPEQRRRSGAAAICRRQVRHHLPAAGRGRRCHLADEVDVDHDGAGQRDLSDRHPTAQSRVPSFRERCARSESRMLARFGSGPSAFARNDDDSSRRGASTVTAETIIQSLASGLLMGLLYGLIAVGLALIFGLMDVVNFAHGEFLMIAMYATFFLFAYFALDPLLAAPMVAAALFVFGAVVYLLIVRFAVRAKANAGMVQIFSTFGLAIADARAGAIFFTPDYRSITAFLARRQNDLDRAASILPEPQLVGALICDCGLRRALFLHPPHRFRPRAGSNARRCRRGGAGRHRQEQGVRAGLGPRRGAGRACRRGHGDVLLRLPDVGASFATDRLCHGGARRLRQRVRRLCRRHRRRPGRGHHRADACRPR